MTLRTLVQTWADVRRTFSDIQNAWNRYGTATLVGGTIDVLYPDVKTGTLIQVTRTTTGGTAGHLSVAITAGVKFTINSSSGTDTSTVLWRILD